MLVDVTSKANDEMVKLSPFYPHGGIPVPFTEGMTASCVEAIWQGLKVFEHCDVDTAMFANTTMRGLKRTVRRFGKPLGHRKGVNGTELLGYIEARKQIYLPAYRWMLEHKVQDIIERLRKASQTQTIVLLDYNTNADVEDGSTPLSHASLVKAYIERKSDCSANRWHHPLRYSVSDIINQQLTNNEENLFLHRRQSASRTD